MKSSAYLAIAAVSALVLAAAASSQTTPTDNATAVQESAATSQGAATPSSAATPQSAQHLSKVRIVRISEIRGAVQIDRGNGRGFETAITNLPVIEGNRIKTTMGVAEIELEDNSTVRVAVDSEVEFPQLSRTSDGSTISTVHVIKGGAYVSLVKSKAPNQFDLTFADRKIAVPPGTHFRLQTDSDAARIALFDGTVQVDGPGAPVTLTKKKSVTLLLHAPEVQPSFSKIEEYPLDDWDKQATQYHARVASFGAFGNSPYSYGVNDMMYYGAFSNVGGCGSMWRPYFASAAWDPYANGSWAYYQGAGYSWVSPYPWGWTPFHYGSWNYCQGAGWGWMPGGGWNGLDNTGYYYNGANLPAGSSSPMMRLHGPVGRPIAPPHPGQPTLLPISRQPLVHNELQNGSAFVFKRDSAGMGIPRDGTLGKLDRFSVQAVNHGTAHTPVYLSVGSGMQPASGNMRGNAGAMVTMHRGVQSPVYSGMTSPAMGGNYGGGSNGVSMRGAPSGVSMSSGASMGGASMGHAGGGGPAPAPSSGSHK